MNKTLHYLILFVFLLFLAEFSQAEEKQFASARHALGFSVESASGPGFTYRIYSSRSYFQGTFFGRFTSRDDITDFVIGASYGHVLSEISIVKSFPPTALMFNSGISGVYSKDQNIDSATNAEAGDEKSVHTGVGIALEIGNTFSPGLLFTLGTSYTLSMDRQDGNWDWNLGPQISVGMLYNW